ncbi:hypothetical protein D3C76_1695910 [compost metagenome]
MRGACHRHVLDSFPDLFGDLPCTFTVGFSQDHRKLLATVAGHQVRRAVDMGTDNIGQRPQCFVTSLMAMLIIKSLEVIGIDHQQR